MSAPPPPCDWQTTRREVKERGSYLLETGVWSDCRFIVGTEPNQQVLEGHKLFLAMASPVFEAMFYGGMAEKDPIAILDVQPDAFKALLEYIYTDKINLTSFDQACELCYGAKKYMLPHLVEECTKYLWSDLFPKNACRAYEFAKLFEEPVLMDKCLQIIRNQTQEVLSESSFDDAEISTIITIFEQEILNITSELDLFNALTRYAARHNHSTGAKVPRLEGNSSIDGAVPRYPTIRDALVKIRFLTLSPQQFAEGPAASNLLTQQEKFSILMNISSPSTAVQMPDGFSSAASRRRRNSGSSNNEILFKQGYLMDTSRTSMISFPNQPGSSSMSGMNGNGEPMPKQYCNRQLLRITECMNTSVLDCAVTFTCDKNICVHGIQVPSQILVDVEDRQQQSISNSTYSELLYAHLLDADGSRLTYTHFTSRVKYRSLIDISFNRPFYIQKAKVYKVGVVLNKIGWYPIGTYTEMSSSNGMIFTFGNGQLGDSVRDGLIRSIIYSIPPANQSTTTSSVPGNRDGSL
ncbi:BTB/POZ domain-containing protein 1 isoform X1 [Onthophagus taurus]|uniref:BTB/POZ domain-containing protein 1 isoform X1 n=1 Tax=Onthophagus taurus TaxID=166361 RepID=UPI0039BE39DF